MSAPLTPAEREALNLTALLANQIGKIIGDGPTGRADWAEICAHIHAIQHAIMSQAAARAYPGEFRLLGGVIGAGIEVGDG